MSERSGDACAHIRIRIRIRLRIRTMTRLNIFNFSSSIRNLHPLPPSAYRETLGRFKYSMAGGRRYRRRSKRVQKEIVQVLTSQAICDMRRNIPIPLESLRGQRCASFEPISSLIEIELRTHPLTQAG